MTRKIPPMTAAGVVRGDPQPPAIGAGASPIEVGGKVHQLSNMKGAVRSSFEFTASLPDIAPAVEHLRAHGRKASWIAFLFNTTVRSPVTDDHSVALQYSFIDRVGLDWVLRGPRNVEDRKRVARLAKARGHRVMEREMNDVRFLRIESGDIAQLGLDIASELYRVPPDYPLGVLLDGIPVPSLASRRNLAS